MFNFCKSSMFALITSSDIHVLRHNNLDRSRITDCKNSSFVPSIRKEYLQFFVDHGHYSTCSQHCGPYGQLNSFSSILTRIREMRPTFLHSNFIMLQILDLSPLKVNTIFGSDSLFKKIVMSTGPETSSNSCIKLLNVILRLIQ